MDGIRTIALTCLHPKISFCLLLYISALLLPLSAGFASASTPDSVRIARAENSYPASDSEVSAHLENAVVLTSAISGAETPLNTLVVAFSLLMVALLTLFFYLVTQIRRTRMLMERAVEVNRMKSRFYADLSHEFRAPLTLILAPIDEMIERTQSQEMRRYLMPVRKNAERLLELVNQLMDLARIESGKLQLGLTRNDVVAVVKGVVMSFESLAAMKEIRLSVTTEDCPAEMFLDRDKVEKIVANLLSNAMKFTPEKGSIAVDVRRIPGRPGTPPECLQILVKDSGKGIPKGEIAHIFDRYYQVKDIDSRKESGYGVGLALVKELVELHRGSIRAASDGNAGTEMYVQLPLNLGLVLNACVVEDVGVVSVYPSRSATDRGEDSGNARGMEKAAPGFTVLLIEDNADVRRYVRNTLANIYEVIEVSNGEEGIAVAREKVPDLILCDVVMPEINGCQVCASLKNDERTSHIPIILLTAKADVESRIEGLETGADDYLMKPFVAKELRTRIRNLIESRRKLRERYHQLVMKPGEIGVNSIDERFLQRTMLVLERHVGDDRFTTEEFSEEMGMSRSHLHRKLKSLVGQGPNQFIRSFRLNRAHEMLKRNSGTAAEVAYAVGFGSPSYFTKCFHEKFGYTPSEMIHHEQQPLPA